MKKKYGFTLIELSIVLVIIGLVVGGVFVGRDMIEASQLRKIISDFEKYSTAVNTFKNKYACLPGDCPQAVTLGLGTNGDGDGTVDYIYLPSNNWLESYYFWQHLGNAKLVGGAYSGTATLGCHGVYCHDAGINVPKGIISGSMVSAFYFSTCGSIGGFCREWSPILNAHVMTLSSGSYNDNVPSGGGYLNLWANPALTPLQQKSLDIKIDDGMPYTGDMVDMLNSDIAPYSPHCTTSEVLTTAAYDISRSTRECILIWRAPF